MMKRSGLVRPIEWHIIVSMVFNIRIVRIIKTYGPRMGSDGHYGRVIPRFLSQAKNNQPITIFGDGTQTRSFCYVTDQIIGLLNLAGEVVNIGNPTEHTVIDHAIIIKCLLNSSSSFMYNPLPLDDPMRRFPDISKVKRLFYNLNRKLVFKKGLSGLLRI